MWASGGKRGFLDTPDNMKLIEGYDKVAAFRAAHGYNSAGILIDTACMHGLKPVASPTITTTPQLLGLTWSFHSRMIHPRVLQSSLVLVASNVLNKEQLLSGIKGAMHVYDYNSTAQDIVELVHALAQQNEGPFGSIAVLCDNGESLLSLCATMVVVNERDLAETDVFQVLLAIGTCVKPKGRVELIACRLDSTPTGKGFLTKLSDVTGKQFAVRGEKRSTGGASAASTMAVSGSLVADTLSDAHAGRRIASSRAAGKSTPVVEAPTHH
jgi:hypothetical protein